MGAKLEQPCATLATDHPYNTYRRAGLPPGPIASPGLGAIEAAVEPASVDYLFFVKEDEKHHRFSRTLEEHNEAAAQYRASYTLPSRLRQRGSQPTLRGPEHW
jgi:cell division protein YceG involved in septum cleavage